MSTEFDGLKHTQTPFALSLSKCPCILSLSKGLNLSKCLGEYSQGFDKLSPNGVVLCSVHLYSRSS
jgi:hypothetical protein